MARKKKNGSQDKTLHRLVLATAILNLVRAVCDLLETVLE